MSHVIMVARVGDQEVHVGKCTHAQARILVKKEHGRIEDGKIVLNLRPVHVQVAEQMIERDANPNVSKAELNRRMEWLREVAGVVVNLDLASIDNGEKRALQRIASNPLQKRKAEVLPELTVEIDSELQSFLEADFGNDPDDDSDWDTLVRELEEDREKNREEIDSLSKMWENVSPQTLERVFSITSPSAAARAVRSGVPHNRAFAVAAEAEEGDLDLSDLWESVEDQILDQLIDKQTSLSPTPTYSEERYLKELEEQRLEAISLRDLRPSE